jgi:hypothetical protein
MALSKSPVFVQIILPIAILVVSSVVTLWPTITESKKGLRYEVVAVTPLGPTQAKGFGDLRLMKGDKPIERPYLATVRFITGGKPIEQSDFASSVTIKSAAKPGSVFFWKFGMQDLPLEKLSGEKLGGHETWNPVFIDARVAARNPNNLPVTVTYTAQAVNIAPLLLNPSDEFLIEILVNGGPPVLTAEARVAGIKELEKIVPSPDAKSHRNGIICIVLAAALLVVAFLVWASRSLFRRFGNNAVLPIGRIAWALAAFVITTATSALLFRQGVALLNVEEFGRSFWLLVFLVYAVPVAVVSPTVYRAFRHAGAQRPVT